MCVSEKTRCYCQPDMTSSSVLRQEALHSHVHEGFWRSDHDFLIEFLSNFLSLPRLRGFIASRIWRHRDFSTRRRLTLFCMTVSARATMTSWWRSIVTFYLGCMVSEITRFYCQPDMTSSSVLRLRALHAHFQNGFWKSDHDFLIAFHSKFLSGMHGYRN